MPPETPQTKERAIALLERFATLEGDVGLIENARNDAIAAANKSADASLEPLIEERDQIRAALEPWWKQAAAELTGGKRKSAELGGCMIGTRSGRASLDIAGDEDGIVKKLLKRDWAGDLLRVTTKLDKAAILKALPGTNGKQLRAMGLKTKPGAETFFVERTEQAGTGASA